MRTGGGRGEGRKGGREETDRFIVGEEILGKAVLVLPSLATQAWKLSL